MKISLSCDIWYYHTYKSYICLQYVITNFAHISQGYITVDKTHDKILIFLDDGFKFILKKINVPNFKLINKSKYFVNIPCNHKKFIFYVLLI